MKRLILAAVSAIALAVAGTMPAFAGGFEIQQEEHGTRWINNRTGETVPLGETSGIVFDFATLATGLTKYAVSPKTGYIMRAFYVTGSPAAGTQSSSANTVDFWLESVTNGNFLRITGLEFKIKPSTPTATNDSMDAINVAGQQWDPSTKVSKGQVIAVHTGGGGTGTVPTEIQVIVE